MQGHDAWTERRATRLPAWNLQSGVAMALQLDALREALIDAGAKPEKADKAAEELAGSERAFSEIKSDLRVLKRACLAPFASATAIIITLFEHG